jgi:hypothetical protein
MAYQLDWDLTGERLYETGVDHGVVYPMVEGAYPKGYAWNGLSSVQESPSGAEATAIYADNIKYLNLISNEDFGATVEAYNYPPEFAECDGTATLGGIEGVYVGQQKRKQFGLCYRTVIGNDADGNDHGFKIHLIYGATAAPSEKSFGTINDSPEAITFSWTLSTTPVAVGKINNIEFKPTASITIDSTKVAKAKMDDLLDILYGTAATTGDNPTEAVDARLPLPAEVYSILAA